MSRSRFGTRLNQVFAALLPGSSSEDCRPKLSRSPHLEILEGRALMATINASATISSVADGSDFKYTVTLQNSNSSNSGIGTFWYAWVPGEDFLATSPISVSPPAGWTDNITHSTSSPDGYAIQFLASSSGNDVQPGSSMTFSFVSADAPSAVNGNSADHPGTPVDTSFVYPGAPFSDAGHQFVATPTSSSPTPTPTPITAPLVWVTGVHLVRNRAKMVTEVVVDFSGPVNASEADSVATYRLATAGKNHSFTAKNAMVLRLKSAAFNGTSDAVVLTPRRAFALTKPVELVVNGQALQDSSGRLIDGAHDGQPGSNFVTVLRNSTASSTLSPTPTPILPRTPIYSPNVPTPVSTPTPARNPSPTPTPTLPRLPGY
jgi:hypothetical protein